MVCRTPAQQRQGPERRAIILRPRPIADVERAVGIDARFGTNRCPMGACQIVPQELGELRQRLGRRRLAAVERRQVRTEADEIGEQMFGIGDFLLDQEQRYQWKK
jgi:hypothetical protein